MLDSQGRLDLDSMLDRLVGEYQELQPPIPDVLHQPPSAVQALRMIHRAHPAVIEGFSPLTPLAEGLDWDAPDTYAKVLGAGEVTVAVTDDGLADSVRDLDHASQSGSSAIAASSGSGGDSLAFVKPLEERMPIRSFLSQLANPSRSEILYLQSQDGNIYRSEPRPEQGLTELEGMREFIRRDVPWMQEALGMSAEAVNLWIGTSRSVTSMHHDPYDNIYYVVSGSKTFTLVSPLEGLHLIQKFYPPATLIRDTNGSLRPRLDPGPARHVPWIASPEIPPRIQPIRVTVQQGQTLFLPSGWWHRVEQAEGPGGLAVAVNYWYTNEIHPEREALLRFAHRIARAAGWEGVIPVDADEGSEEGDGGDEVTRESLPNSGGAAAGTVPEGIWGDEDEDGSGTEWEPSQWGR